MHASIKRRKPGRDSALDPARGSRLCPPSIKIDECGDRPTHFLSSSPLIPRNGKDDERRSTNRRSTPSPPEIMHVTGSTVVSGLRIKPRGGSLARTEADSFPWLIRFAAIALIRSTPPPIVFLAAFNRRFIFSRVGRRAFYRAAR